MEKEQYENLKERLISLEKALKLEDKKNKVAQLEMDSTDSELWQNPYKAREITIALAHMREEVLQWEVLEKRILDLKDVYEVADDKDLEQIEKALRLVELKTFLNGPYDHGNAVIYFYAGAGGDDAQEWTEMLVEMYKKYAEQSGWKTAILHESRGEIAGLKEAVLEIKGNSAYGFLRNESGVHRLVRISPFSTKSLRHTSFSLVEVLPEIQEVNENLRINPRDLKIETAKSSGPGGQNVNKRMTAARIVHLPTGISAASQSERSLEQNKEKAIKILTAKLYKVLQEQHKKTMDDLKENVKPEWGSQIRSYILDPYKKVKDHRTSYEDNDPESVLNGKIQGFIEISMKRA